MRIKQGDESIYAAIDFGLTNIDLAVQEGSGAAVQTWVLPNPRAENPVEAALSQIGFSPSDFTWIAVTGGRYRELPDACQGVPLVKVGEIDAIGAGGLHLANVKRALVVSAGSGTAMAVADEGASQHVTGSAVGGGTLQGLGRLLLGTSDAEEIDRLAGSGDANAVDLTLLEAIGATVGGLPPEANAVNFGRAAKTDVSPTPHDVAAGLVRLVAQVIGVIAINAAKAAGMEHIVFTGHLLDLSTVCRELHTTAGYYEAAFTIPENPGTGTVLGAFSQAMNNEVNK